MPSLKDFPNHMMAYTKNVILISGKNLNEAGTFGAEYMRHYISADSQTGSKWHAEKNDINGFQPGARIGGKAFQESRYRIYQPSGHSGQMLSAVQSGKLSQSGKTLSIRFGWINNQQDYFLLQDTGDYRASASGRARGVGMGLLNERYGSGRKTLQKLGAYHATKNHLIAQMKASGFSVSGVSDV